MSHEIDMSNERANMAYTGSKPWHGLGQELTPGLPIEEWQVQAGMNWQAQESPLWFSPGNLPKQRIPKKKALYRSDTNVPLSIVGEDFNVVQPSEVLEFFRDLTEVHGMQLSTAGCLFGGTRFWALAETGREGEVTRGDLIKGYLMFVTSIDGTLSNTAKFISTRVVCNNTLSIAMKEQGKMMVRKTHRTIWDPTQVKIDLGLLDKTWETFMTNLRRLGQHRMEQEEVTEFFKKTFYDPNQDEENQPIGPKKCVQNLNHLYEQGDGAELSYGTAFGALNAITNLFTHGNGRKRIPDRRFWDAYFGNDSIKNDAMESLLTLC